MKEHINTNMLIMAREARSLNQNELAEKINMSPTNLSKIERGDIGVNEELLKLIANITGYPKHFFLQEGEIIPPYLTYRKRHNVSQKFLNTINAKTNIIGRHVQFLSSALQIPATVLHSINANEKPESIAAKTRRKWDINNGPVGNMTSLLEDHGIVVSSFDFGTHRVDSKSLFTDDKQPVIFFNSSLLGDRQRFTMAFELGQLLMYRSGDVALERDVIHEANVFASEFLMPAKDIKEDFKRGISIALLAELKKKWKVSMIALLYRADDLGFLSSNQKRYLIQQSN
jgi:Zn-dependent peptidase ImmA (M78 family)/transcriptional regulator with XRE-family HTH domain